MTRRGASIAWTAGAALLLAVALTAWLATAGRSAPAPGPGAEIASAPASETASVSLEPAVPAEERPEVGYLAPDFALPDLAGRTVRLSDFRGRKAVFLNFWATWCPPCRAEMPTMERAYQAYRDRGLEILAVSVDTGPKDRVAAFTQELKLTFPALLDPDMAILYAYRIPGLPGSVLIDRRGVIQSVEIGFRDWDTPESRDKLERLLR
jgi:peroxiredoxin